MGQGKWAYSSHHCLPFNLLSNWEGEEMEADKQTEKFEVQDMALGVRWSWAQVVAQMKKTESGAKKHTPQ